MDITTLATTALEIRILMIITNVYSVSRNCQERYIKKSFDSHFDSHVLSLIMSFIPADSSVRHNIHFGMGAIHVLRLSHRE